MKFKSETGNSLPQGDLEEQYRQAVDLGKVRAGEHCLFYPKFSYVGCLPYEELRQVYLRKEEVVTRLCCGTADLSPIFVMVVGTDGQTRKTEIRNKEMGQALLDHVAKCAPHVEIGYRKGQNAPTSM